MFTPSDMRKKYVAWIKKELEKIFPSCLIGMIIEYARLRDLCTSTKIDINIENNKFDKYDRVMVFNNVPIIESFHPFSAVRFVDTNNYFAKAESVLDTIRTINKNYKFNKKNLFAFTKEKIYVVDKQSEILTTLDNNAIVLTRIVLGREFSKIEIHVRDRYDIENIFADGDIIGIMCIMCRLYYGRNPLIERAIVLLKNNIVFMVIDNRKNENKVNDKFDNKVNNIKHIHIKHIHINCSSFDKIVIKNNMLFASCRIYELVPPRRFNKLLAVNLDSETYKLRYKLRTVKHVNIDELFATEDELIIIDKQKSFLNVYDYRTNFLGKIYYGGYNISNAIASAITDDNNMYFITKQYHPFMVGYMRY